MMQTFNETLGNLSNENKNKAAVIAIWSARADCYDVTLSEKQLKKYSDLTAHFPAKILIKLLDAHYGTDYGHIMPTPAHVFKMAKKGLKMPSEDDSTLMAQEIYEGLLRSGVCQSSAGDRGEQIYLRPYEEWKTQTGVCGVDYYMITDEEKKERDIKKVLSDIQYAYVKRRGIKVLAREVLELQQGMWIAQNRESIKAFLREYNASTEEKLLGFEPVPIDDLLKVVHNFEAQEAKKIEAKEKQ